MHSRTLTHTCTCLRAHIQGCAHTQTHRGGWTLASALTGRKCVGLVGTMTSNVSRLIYELIIGLLGKVDNIKVQSLDSEWYIEV